MTVKTTAKPGPVKTPPAIEAGRRPNIEQLLNELAFDWTYMPGMPLSEFDRDMGLANQARLGTPLNMEVVERYRASVEEGAAFPGVIAWRKRGRVSGDATVVVADGNHRWEAHHLAHRSIIDAYVVTGATPAAVTMLTFRANLDHGLPTTMEERIHHGRWMVDGGLPIAKAATMLGLPVAKLTVAIHLDKAARRADQVGILRTRWDSLTDEVAGRLGQVRDDDGFKALAQLAMDAKLNAKEVGVHVNDIKPLRTSKKQVEFVDALRRTYAERIQTGGMALSRKGRQERSARQALSMVLGQIKVLPPPADIVALMTDEEREEYAERTDQAMNTLHAIMKACDA